MASPSELRILGGDLVRGTKVEPCDLVARGSQVEQVIDRNDRTRRQTVDSRRNGDLPVTAVDASGLLVSPGFIDLQINGGHGIDLTSDPAGLWDLAQILPRYGVTAFLPTVVSAPPMVYALAIKALARRPADHRGSEPIGLHFEGPMLNPARRGAHREAHLVPPSAEVIADWERSTGVALVTLAPELPGAAAVIESLRNRDVVVSAGHSSASADETDLAEGWGLSMVTHLFNAMDQLHHRTPGLAGAALTGDLVAGLIADGVHVHPSIVDLAFRAKGPERLVLVSDAVAAMGATDGRLDLGDRVLRIDGAAVRTDDGVLAGSSLTLDGAIRNLVAFTSCSATEALATVTATPAAVLKDAERGVLAAGRRADVTLLRPDLTVAITVCGGEVVHVADDELHRITPGGRQTLTDADGNRTAAVAAVRPTLPQPSTPAPPLGPTQQYR